MIRSMYSGISGLKNFQTKLDVIGNNIANVNTYGFKKGRTIFKDLISQTTSGASAATGTRGGVNAKQVGLGSQLSAIDTIHSGGSLQSTGNTLDLAISGDGFFMVGDGQVTKAADGTVTTSEGFTSVLYTRAGNFYMDSNGSLVNADGKYLVGFAADDISDTLTPEGQETTIITKPEDTSAGENLSVNGANPTSTAGTYQPIRIPTNAQSMSIGQDGTVNYVDINGKLQYAGTIAMAKFSNPGGLQKVGSNYFQQTANSGDQYVQFGTAGGMGSVNSGFLEMSNVDLSEEFTDMIVAQRGFQANTRIITTSDQILEELVNLKR